MRIQGADILILPSHTEYTQTETETETETQTKAKRAISKH